MFIYISICITLLTIIAAMHLLLKANAQQVSSLFKWIAYFIVLVGLLILFCQIARGIMRMRHHGNEDCKEECHPWLKCDRGMTGMHGCMMNGHGNMRCCDMDEDDDKECCEGMIKGDSAHMKVECKVIMNKGEKEGEKEEEEKSENK
jgi:hypothetical protein